MSANTGATFGAETIAALEKEFAPPSPSVKEKLIFRVL